MKLFDRNRKNSIEVENCFIKHSKNVEIVNLNSVIIPSTCNLEREMPRPIELREDSYEEKFDNKTLFYDVFQVEDEIFLIGPPLHNLKSIMENSSIYIDNIKIDGLNITWGEQLRYTITKIKFENTSRRYRLKIVNEYFTSETYISRNRTEEQKNKDVLVAINKNNKIDWIYDWAKFYYHSEGINTVIIYDNNSTNYSVEQLATKLSVLNKIKFYIVKTPFPFGPQGGWLDLNGKLTQLPFDSFYLQASMLSHARFFFCNQANFYLNADIDELVVEKTGDKIKNVMKEKNLSYACFSQVYIYSSEVNDDLKLADVYLKDKDSTYGCQKWACFPKQIDESRQFDIHVIHGLRSTFVNNIVKYHLYPISSNWRDSRNNKTLSKDNDTICRDLAIKFNDIFNSNIYLDNINDIEKCIIDKYGDSKVEILREGTLKLLLSKDYSYMIDFSQKSTVIKIGIIAKQNFRLMEIYSLLQQHMLLSPPDSFVGDPFKRNKLEVVNIPFDNLYKLDEKIYDVIENLENIIGKE